MAETSRGITQNRTNEILLTIHTLDPFILSYFDSWLSWLTCATTSMHFYGKFTALHQPKIKTNKSEHCKYLLDKYI